MDNFETKVITSVGRDGKTITQDVIDIHGEISRKVIKTADNDVREALKSLGWIPPEDKNKMATDAYFRAIKTLNIDPYQYIADVFGMKNRDEAKVMMFRMAFSG